MAPAGPGRAPAADSPGRRGARRPLPPAPGRYQDPDCAGQRCPRGPDPPAATRRRRRCLVLVTSPCRRTRLKGLDDASILSLDVLPQVDAVALLRSVAARGRELPLDPLLAEIADLCGRLPLALRIAAALLRHRPAWSLEHLAALLVLTRGARSGARKSPNPYRSCTKRYPAIGLVYSSDHWSGNGVRACPCCPGTSRIALMVALHLTLGGTEGPGHVRNAQCPSCAIPGCWASAARHADARVTPRRYPGRGSACILTCLAASPVPSSTCWRVPMSMQSSLRCRTGCWVAHDAADQRPIRVPMDGRHAGGTRPRPALTQARPPGSRGPCSATSAPQHRSACSNLSDARKPCTTTTSAPCSGRCWDLTGSAALLPPGLAQRLDGHTVLLGSSGEPARCFS